MLNKWLNSTVETYIKQFGATTKPVVYEVGSRDGHDGVELARRIYDGNNIWKDATIVLFECNPPQIEAIKSNYPKATLVPNAVSNKKGTAEFLQIHGDKNMVGSSTLNLNRNDSWIKQTSKVQVQTRRLDEVIRSLKHDKLEIDIMKIDIEGFTYEALEGLGKLLHNVKVLHLETEITGHARNKNNLDIALFMQNNGYICSNIEYEWPPAIQDQIWYRRG